MTPELQFESALEDLTQQLGCTLEELHSDAAARVPEGARAPERA